MLKIYQDPSNSNITRWEFNNTTTWEDFHNAIDTLKTQASEANEPFGVIATTSSQMPRGNALSHLNRLIKTVSDNPNILHFVIVNHKANPVGKAFMGMAFKLFGGTDKVHIVNSEEEALAITVKSKQ